MRARNIKTWLDLPACQTHRPGNEGVATLKAFQGSEMVYLVPSPPSDGGRWKELKGHVAQQQPRNIPALEIYMEEWAKIPATGNVQSLPTKTHNKVLRISFVTDQILFSCTIIQTNNHLKKL